MQLDRTKSAFVAMTIVAAVIGFGLAVGKVLAHFDLSPIWIVPVYFGVAIVGSFVADVVAARRAR